MQSESNIDYQELLSSLLKKQMIIFGPDIVIAKLSNVAGLRVSDYGTITALTQDPKTVAQKIIDELSTLSSFTVKNTMQPLLEKVKQSEEPQDFQPEKEMLEEDIIPEQYKLKPEIHHTMQD